MGNFAKSGLLLMVSCTICLLLAEAGVRYFIPPYQSVKEINERYIYGFRPNSWTYYKHPPENGGRTVYVNINSLGYRGDEPDLRPETIRLAVYGDSFIHAEYSSIEETFVEKLQEYLRRPGMASLEVINAGVPGYGPDQSSLRIEDEITSLGPDVLVLSIFAGNDYGDLMRNKIYRLSADGELLANHFRIAPEIRELFENKKKLFSEENILNRSMFVRTLKMLYWSRAEARARNQQLTHHYGQKYFLEIARNRKQEYTDYILEGNNEVTIAGDGYDVDISIEPEAEASRYKVALMEQVILRIGEIASENAIPLILVLIPSPIDVCDGYETQVDRRVYPGYVPSGPTDALEQVAARHGIAYVNLFPVFRDADCNSLYFHHGNDHWNAKGQQLAAETLVRYLDEHRLVGKRAAGYRSQ